MPTYEYRCPDGHTFERRAKMSEAASELSCPECGKIAMRQLSGGAGLVFKGSGFYLTDYGKNAHRGTAPETAASKARKDGDSSGDSKSAEKSGDGKAADAKQAQSKSSDTKTSDAKSGDAKPSEKSASASGSSPGSSSKKSDA